MPRPKRSPVRQYHDRVAPRYDDIYGDAFWRWHDGLTWDYIKPFLPRDLKAEIIDLGCGTGKWAARFIKSGYAVTCVDISPRMLEQARTKLEAFGAQSHVRFVQADLCDLAALPPGTFALAVALGEPIGCCESPRRAMTEIHRVLGQDGVLVATFDNRLAALDYFLERGDADALERFLRDGRAHWLTQDVAERFPIHTFLPGDVIKLAERSGFQVLDVTGKTVLPLRRYRQLLEAPEALRRWARIEKRLCRVREAIGRAPHLQIACRAIKVN